MSNNDPTTLIRYSGPNVERALSENPEIHQMINEWAATLKHTTLHINTECEEGDATLHWAVAVSSPQGRQSYDIKRYTPKGIIQFIRA